MEDARHRQIRDLLSRYAQALDDGDVLAVLACFVPDARTTYNGGEIRVNGHAELKPFFERALGAPSTHLLSNTIVEFSGDVALTRSSAVAFVTRDEGRVLVRGLTYETRCVRDDGGAWKISDLTHRLTWQCAVPSGAAALAAAGKS